ncbi:MAG: hypothetical protein E1N59_2336 [Puniceicoccaceae bacterium 5H]|nr:MAG: hypothetical protein E1N59_2336 [Puniceicoccaceae bacterium 5H]
MRDALHLVLPSDALDIIVPILERMREAAPRSRHHPLQEDEPEIAAELEGNYDGHTSRATQYVVKLLTENQQGVVTIHDLPLALHGVIELRFRLFEHAFDGEITTVQSLPQNAEQLAYWVLMELEMKLLQQMD